MNLLVPFATEDGEFQGPSISEFFPGPLLFEDTPFNNIAYGTRGVKPEQVEEAARKAYAHDFIVERGRRCQAERGHMKVL